MARSRTAAGRRLLLGRPRRPETRLVAPRSRNALTSRNTCRRRKPISSPASRIVMRPASRSSRTSSRENSLLLIDTTVIGPVLLQPRITGECHLNFVQGCHLYIAVTHCLLITLYYGTRFEVFAALIGAAGAGAKENPAEGLFGGIRSGSRTICNYDVW